jgi:L-asparaginase
VGRHLRAPSPPEAFDPRIETNVLAVRIFPGLDPRLLYAALRTNIRGLVLVAFGSGNLPQRENSLIPVVRMATERDIPVVVVSQCPRGAVDLRRYEGGTSALGAGAIGAGTMSIEAATAKLMVALGRATEGARVAAARQAFAEVWAGEVD